MVVKRPLSLLISAHFHGVDICQNKSLDIIAINNQVLVDARKKYQDPAGNDYYLNTEPKTTYIIPEGYSPLEELL